jgi:hypothetical protein
MNIGTKVTRKVDLRKGLLFGTVTGIEQGNKARVLWEYSHSHSSISVRSLVEVTPELEQELEAKAKADHEERRRQWEADHPYVCNNVNPLARVSNDGHPRPLRVGGAQVVDGKCWYCGHPVVLREQAK